MSALDKMIWKALRKRINGLHWICPTEAGKIPYPSHTDLGSPGRAYSTSGDGGDHRRFVRRAHFVGCLQMRRCD